MHNKKLVVGIISVPLSPDKKFFSVCGDSYLANSHIKWLKSQNIEPLVIPYNTKNLKPYLKLVDGLYFPSGGAFAVTQPEYYKCCKKLLHLAMKENDKGNYFPIWGCCMGFQQMLIITDGKDDTENFLEKFDSYGNLMCDIKFTTEGEQTRIARGIDDKIKKRLTRKKCSLNNHKLGISVRKFKKNKKLTDFYNIVGTSRDRKNKEFVTIIEARHYPFYAVQWHPERDSEMNTFIKFFAREIRKNRRPKKTIKHIKKYQPLHTKKVDCYKYSGGLYKKCNFYWHKRTSLHNKALCNMAQLRKSEKQKADGA